MEDTLIKFAGGQASIQSFGSDNPQVMAFLNATFALENLGQLQGVNEVAAQSIGNAMRSSGIAVG